MNRIWLSLVAIVVVGGIFGLAWLISLAGPACPKGQHLVLLYEQPVSMVVNKEPITTMVPVYGCRP